MPSTYAHYQFGKEVFKRLPKEIKQEIQKDMPLYKIGLHGPDILFYYKALTSNPVNNVGYTMHQRAAKGFFEAAKEVVQQSDEPIKSLAYVYGFICHFALDSQCHGYIDMKINQSGVSHTEIEVEFDRTLMVRGGHDPVKKKLTRHILPSQENAERIAPFFKGISPRNVQKALVSMIRYNNLLVAPGKIKRNIIYLLLRLTGNEKEMKGLVVNYTPNPKCADSCMYLQKLYEEGILVAIELIRNYRDFVNQNTPLQRRFERTYGGN